MKNLAFIKSFEHYSEIKESSFVPCEPDFQKDVVNTESDLLLSIYAPDPQTGIPRSDLAIIMSRDASPEVSQFIRDNLLREVGHSAGVDSADMALDCVKDRTESIEHYMERIRDITDKYTKKD